ncbi:Protein phosphatase 2c-like protein [Plasmodium coatneyi]|uniref:Protein phosphatase 2c-like protein n=1 Tax=Plasmodium coatneyi TaxID=208452 RepID=A0A1B1E499_9APIC|nr:Protein phosphatase 2c-like protein [Plasmodium coatneyi]ANQ09816.1 Protein phosphatase 2c-like protein [Plasmodium coatneyi]
MGNCISFISYSKFKFKKKKYVQSDVDSNPEYERAADSNAYHRSEKSRRGKDPGGEGSTVYQSSWVSDRFNEAYKDGSIHVHSRTPSDNDKSEEEMDEQRRASQHISNSSSDQSDVLMINGKGKKKGKKKAKRQSKRRSEVDPREEHTNEADKNEHKSYMNGKIQLDSSKGKKKKEVPQSGSSNEDDTNGTYNHHVDAPSKKNSSFYSNLINTNDLCKKNKRENLLNIKYSNMILNDIRDVDIIVVFLFSLFLYFNANNIVDMLDPNKKDRYALRNSLNINHDIMKFPTFPKEIIDSFLKNDFTLLKKYIKNKCNKLKKKYKSTYLKKVVGSDEEGEDQQQNGQPHQKEEKCVKKKNFKYELKRKKEKCSFSKIVESVDRNEWIKRDITEIPCDQNLPDLNITFIVMGAYCLYQKNTKPFQDKNTFFYKSPSYTCDAEISVACKKGRKLDFPNQDDFTIIQTNQWILIMVFDGHGPSGHDISNFAHVVLPLLFSYNIERIYENPVRTMKTLFYMINCYLVNYSYCINNNINPININFIDYNLSGTTCTIILYNFETKKIYSAHTGDSRAVMGKQNQQTNTFRAYNITEDHKPSLKLEKDRIVAFGGEVKKLQGDVSYRVFVKNEMYPGLAMSRAIGDITSSFIGVTCEPTIKIFDKSEEDKFIIVATDGIWEFISSEECVQMVSRKRKKKVHVAMEEIIKESWRRWERIDTVDDMTLVILYF